MSDAICTADVWWRYPTFSDSPNPWTLRGVTLQVEQGECFGITGPSGAGKTTLCRMLLGILPYSARLTNEQLPGHFRGSVTALDQAVSAGTALTRQIGMVLQDPENQFLRMSLLHELALGLQLQGFCNDEIEQRAYNALRWVGLEHLWQGASYIHPADLSGGQKQRIAIAAFLAMRPRILILDEPTSDLDPLGKREVIQTIAQLRHDYSTTVLLVEQDPEILAAFCDRIALLHRGRIALVAPPHAFYTNRAMLEACGASAGELTRICWHTGYSYESHPPLTLDEGETAFAQAAQSISASYVPECDRPSVSLREPVVQAEQVCYRYEDGTVALKGISTEVYRGEMLALLGPNGSGKTTFAKVLAGIYRLSGGNVQVLGQDLRLKRVRSQIVRSVGYVFQNPDHQLFCRKVSDEVEYGLKNLGFPSKARQQLVRQTLEAVDLIDYANEDPLFLSKGQRQRLAVAAVLAMGPDILIVDEPTTGQDYRSITAIMRLLCNLQQQGKTILVITHDMTLVVEYCQRVIAFCDGLLTFSGTPQELFQNQDMLQRTGLHSPAAAALTARMRIQREDFPSLLTVEQWSKALGTK